MGAVYAAVSDVALLRQLTAQEEAQCEVLLQYASDRLRVIAAKYGRDLDAMTEESESYASAVKMTVVQAVINALGRLSGSVGGDTAASQATQSALGYSMTYTYANAGQVLWFSNNELKDLGLRRQRYGAIDLYGMG